MVILTSFSVEKEIENLQARLAHYAEKDYVETISYFKRGETYIMDSGSIEVDANQSGSKISNNNEEYYDVPVSNDNVTSYLQNLVDNIIIADCVKAATEEEDRNKVLNHKNSHKKKGNRKSRAKYFQQNISSKLETQ